MGVLEVSVADGTEPVVVLSGEADFQGAVRLSAALDTQISGGTECMLVDVSDLSFADSSAVRVLVLAAQKLRQRRGSLTLLHPQPSVARVLELMGADQIMNLR
jgi:anti-sigma B factor antagonist